MTRSSPRDVLVLITSDQRRGAEVFGEQLTSGLRDRGWGARLVALSIGASGPRVAAAVAADRTRDRLGKISPDVLSTLRRRIATDHPDLVFANGGATLRYAIAAVRLQRPRPVLVYGSIGEPGHWAGSRVSRRLLRSQLALVDHVTAVSTATRRQLLGLGVDPARVSVTPIGADARFAEAVRSADHPGLRVLFLGSLSSEKDPIAAVEAVSRAAESAEVRLRVVGGGDLAPELNRMAKNRPIEVVGPADDVLPHLEWADVLVLTSRTEGLPGVVLEAAFAGVPTVGYEVGGVGEAVSDGTSGILVPRGDIAALAAALVRLAADPAEVCRLGAAAKQRALRDFTLDAAVDRFATLFARLVLPGEDGGR